MDVTRENFVRLGDIAEIKAPRQDRSSLAGKIRRAVDLKYPLPLDSLKKDHATDAELRRGDLVATPNLKVVYLVDIASEQQVYLTFRG